MESYWNKKDDAIAARVRKNWETIEKLVADNPFALNWGPIRPITPRMVGLHPDHPAKKSKKPKVKDLDLN